MCDDCTDLTDAIREENFEEVKRLIEVEKVDINERIKDGVAPLAIAWDEGTPEIVKYLLEHGANPLLEDEFHELPFLNWETEKKVTDYARQLMLEEVKKVIEENKKSPFNN